MSSVCISTCLNDARDPRFPVRPVRATYVNLYKWPESDAEFVRSVRRGGCGAPRVVDSISCRQMYLRSYTFSREEDEKEKKRNAMAQKCFGRVKETVSCGGRGDKEDEGAAGERTKRRRRKGGRGSSSSSSRRKRFALRRMKEVSCSALFRFFNKLLSCAASVDVVDHKD